MVRVTEELALSAEHTTLYSASDPLLGHLPALVFHGPSTTANYTQNSSRVQIHVYTPAGFQSFPRVTISPNSPFYSVVSHLPREFQGDEVCRALAFGLFKYFTELSEAVKNHLKNQYPSTRGRRPGSAPSLFGEHHAAELAKSMVKAENTAEVVQVIESALQTQHVSNVDIDFVLPPGSVVPLQEAELEEVPEDEDDILDPSLRQYVGYGPLVKLLGEPVFLPTSRLRRAPSKPSSLNRSKSFTRDQKVELRLKMAELVETEERYVAKLNELVKHVADEFRQSAKERAAESISPSQEEIQKLFPTSADRILQVNTGFMQALRRVMNETEEEAVKDFDTPFAGSRLDGSTRIKDPSGALAVARVFLEWFPQFTECYQDYIRASQDFPQLLNTFLDRQSSFGQRVAQKGEQAIRSILIEPVQRLPRYSLLIDQIVTCVPITHPALQLLLRARDIITNICSMDDPLPEKPHVANRLRNMVECWPVDLEPQGRLVYAVDFVELAAPFVEEPSTPNTPDRAGLFLIFSDCIVIIKRKAGNKLSGRDLLREVDRPSAVGLLQSMTHAAGGPGLWEFAFTGWHGLADVRFTESGDGRLIWMTSTREMNGTHSGEYVTSKAVTSRCFHLQEAYAGKAAKLGEDIVKARIEGRFAEKEREDPSWSLRSVRMVDNQLGLHAAVFQEAAEQLIEGRKEPAPIRVVVDNHKGTKGAPVGHYGVEIVVEMQSGDLKRVSMNSAGVNGKHFTDDIALEDFLPTLSRRIVQLLSSQFNVSNFRLAPALVSYNTKVLRGLPISSTRIERPKSFLSTSPVKLLSSFWGSNSNSETAAAGARLQKVALGNGSAIFPAQQLLPHSSSQKDLPLLSGSLNGKDSGRSVTEDEGRVNPLMRLEQTFTGYIASLQARKGQFVGRTLLNRSVADELAVNDLYNRLIESPFDLDASAELGAEVVFAAFEKFVQIAWREQMGQIMTMQTLDLLQERAAKRVPGDFADFVNFLFGDMAPQNRRAFTSLIKLLSDLLDGCDNDGDRGALTLAFAELLVTDGAAHNYINILDRLVEASDRLFEEAPFGLQPRGSAYESMNSITRSQKSATGSMTSNSSSLRRKFGLDNLLRQNSKTDGDRPSVWRSLSKHGRQPAAGESSSLSKATVHRSQSIDMGTQPPSPNKLWRPGLRDRPPVVGAFDEFQRPSSSHRLETIGEPEVEPKETRPLKNKRRSSLSDLKALMAAATLEEPPLMPLRINKQTAEKFNSAPRGTSPSKIPISPQSGLRSPNSQKENVAEPLSKSLTLSQTEKPKAMSSSQTEKPKSLSSSQTEKSPERTHLKTMSTSQIPTLKPVRALPAAPELTARPTSSPSKASPQKLRLQSPQKLRERLQVEKKAADEVDASLKTELSRITEDMARVNSALPQSTTTDVHKLAASVRALEARVPQISREIAERQEALQRELEAALRASEAKVRAIDQLYKESTAENELLYEKLNSELAKIVKALKGKGREDKEELVTKLKEQSEEAAKMRKENARLRREMVSLRTLLKGAGTGES